MTVALGHYQIEQFKLLDCRHCKGKLAVENPLSGPVCVIDVVEPNFKTTWLPREQTPNNHASGLTSGGAGDSERVGEGDIIQLPGSEDLESAK